MSFSKEMGIKVVLFKFYLGLHNRREAHPLRRILRLTYNTGVDVLPYKQGRYKERVEMLRACC